MKNDTQLLRQINPSWIQSGRVTSQAFKPTSKDKDKLSAYDGDQITPKNSWEHWTTVLGYESDGVLSVTVSECNQLGLTTISDPNPFPEHVLIVFSGLSRNQIPKAAKQLRAYAVARDWLFRNSS